MNYKLTIAYDGTRYQGWQKNKNAAQTIQTKVEEILSKYTGETVALIASGRTDKGVHASGQVANMHLKRPLNLDVFKGEIHTYLPDDVVIKEIIKVDDRFHARFQAVSKTYDYTLYKGYDNKRPVFDRKYVHIQEDFIHIEKMKEATKLFIGEHDFKGFSSDKTKKSTVRTIESIDIRETDNTVTISVTGNGFLYNMVRIIVGTLIEIGLGSRTSESISQVLKSGIRDQAGFTAEAQGLSLVSVTYK